MTLSGIWPAEPWRRNQYTVTIAVFMVFAGFAFVLPFLPLFVRELGVTDREDIALWAGVLIGVAPLLAGLLAPVWGRLAETYGQKAMAIRALGSYVVLLGLSALVSDVWQLLALRAGIGLFGGIGPLGLAMVTSLAPRDQTGRAVGSVQSAQILAAAVGPLVGGVLADTIGIRPTFLVTAAACAAAMVLLLAYYKEAPATPRENAKGDGGGLLDAMRLPGVWPLMIVLFAVNFVSRSFTPILPLHLQTLSVPATSLAFTTGALISVYSIAAAVSAMLFGRACRTRAPRVLLMASLLGGAALVLPMALLTHLWQFLLVALLFGLASGGSLTLGYTIGGLMVPSERRATAFGFFSAAALFGGAVSPSVAGLLTHWQLKGIYYVDAAVYAALAVALAAGRLAEGRTVATTLPGVAKEAAAAKGSEAVGAPRPAGPEP